VSGPLVSVIMIFLDAERFIEEAIESVFAQTWPHWELLLVDDGSSDRSTAIAKGYAGRHPERVRYLEHPGHANRGMSASRNLGLAHARGELVAFLDADDVFLPERLERHVAVLATHPEADVVQGGVVYWHSWVGAGQVDLHERAPRKVSEEVAPPELLLLLLHSEGGTAPSICGATIRRRTLIEVGGFEEAFRALYEDQVMFAKIYLRSRVYVLDECHALYRQHGDSCTALAVGDPAPMRAYRDRLAFFDWLRTCLEREGVQEPLIWSVVERELRSARSSAHWHATLAFGGGIALVRSALAWILPAPVYHDLLALHGAWKQRRIDRRLARLPASGPPDRAAGDG
jgi:glycosyltransferase involved in cell wall biosynthesis